MPNMNILPNCRTSNSCLHVNSGGNYAIRIILGSLFAAVVANGLITKFLVHNGLAREANPLLSYWVGQGAFLVFKLVGAFLGTIYLFLIYRRHPRLSMGLGALFLTLYTFIIFWNLLILR